MPLVPASPRRRVKLAGFLVATALVLTGCAPKWSSARIPTYEPLPVDISGFPNAADKAKLAEIAGYMRERLVARHVDAPHANAILWQFHFFAPVRYFDDDCSTYVDLMHGERFHNEDEQIKRMGAATKDVLDRYDRTIPHSQLGQGDWCNKNYSLDAIETKNDDPPKMSPIQTEFYQYSMSEVDNSNYKYYKDDRYKEYTSIDWENLAIYHDLDNRIFKKVSEWMNNYHIRNYLINIRLYKK